MSITEDPLPVIDLPVIDTSDSHLSNPAARKAEAERLLSSFSQFGLCRVSGLDADGYSSEDLLRWTRWVFLDIPPEERMGQLANRGFNPANGNLYRGYFPHFGGGVSFKECYDLGPPLEDADVEEGNPFRERAPRLRLPGREEEVEAFYEVMYRHFSILQRTGCKLMSLLAEAGGEEASFFDGMLFSTRLALHTMRLVHYPRRVTNIPPEAYLSGDRILSAHAHRDTGTLVLLDTFGFPGLEIKHGGTWHRVAPATATNTVTLFMGMHLASMFDSRFEATLHRVLDIGRSRFSVPFFFEPHPDAPMAWKVPRALLPPPAPAQAPDGDGDGDTSKATTFGNFLLRRLAQIPYYPEVCRGLSDRARRKYLPEEEREKEEVG